MHGQSYMNPKDEKGVLTTIPCPSASTSVVVDDIYKRQERHLVKLEEMRMRFAYNAHRHTNEHILFWFGIIGSFVAAWDIYTHFSKFSNGMKHISEWSGEHMQTIQSVISGYQVDSSSNAFVTGYNYFIQLLSFGCTFPSGIVHVATHGLYSLSHVGTLLTTYIIFLLLLLLNILLLQVYTKGLYVYAFGTGIVLRDSAQIEQKPRAPISSPPQTAASRQLLLCNDSR